MRRKLTAVLERTLLLTAMSVITWAAEWRLARRKRPPD